MSLPVQELLSHPGNYGGKRTASQIRYLVLHYTGNDGDTARNNACYFRDHLVKASAHYFVDDQSVYRSVPDLRIAWAVGGKRYPNAHKTGGGTMYGVITNTNSIHVELCDTRRDGAYGATEETLSRGAALCRELMERYQIPLSRVYRHFDVTGKLCPRYLVRASAWAQFKARLEESMTQEEFNRHMARWLALRAGEAPAPSSLAARTWAEEQGIIAGFPDGSRQYRAFCTREQIALMLYRFRHSLEQSPPPET